MIKSGPDYMVLKAYEAYSKILPQNSVEIYNLVYTLIMILRTQYHGGVA